MSEHKKLFLKVCPNCGSSNSTLTNLVQSVGNGMLKCKDCGYQGFFIEVEEKDMYKFKAQLKKNQSKKFLKVCPRCGSANIYSNPVQYLNPSIIKCKECGYMGNTIKIEKQNIKKFKNALGKYKTHSAGLKTV